MISILIATHSSYEYIKLCIQSLEKNTSIPFELIIWDNNSDIQTREYLRNCGHRYFRSEENLGLSIPRNRMVDAAKYEIIMLTDNDIYFLPGWDCIVEELQNPISWRMPNVIGPNQWWGIKDTRFGNNVSEFKEDDLVEKYKNYIHPTRHLACLPGPVLRKDDYYNIGGYEEWLLNDEQDFLYRSFLYYKKNNRLQLSHPKSHIYHFGSKTTRPSNWRTEIYKKHKILEKQYNKSIDEMDKEMQYWKIFCNSMDEGGNFISIT